MAVSVQAPPRVGTATTRGLPDPGGSVPRISWPTVSLFFAALAVFAFSSWAAIEHRLPWALTVAANALAIFVMFTVLHDAAHRSLSTIGWVNATLGRAAMVFVSPAMAFPAWSFIHLEHHRWANDPAHDPDSFASSATGWQTPLRWLFMDGPYVAFYTRHRKGRPRGEVVETSLFMVFTVGLIVTTLFTGTFWLLVLVYLIPERIALFVLAWWFDWLPHHGLTSTQRANRYRATRVRVGMEWLFTPLTLSQNYHLVHHLHPSIPFHRYSATWRRNQEAYLDREIAIATVFGRQLTSDEFREWKELNRALLRLVPVRSPKRTSASYPVFHQLRVRSVEALTADSVVISFDVPPELRTAFRFQAGQHVTVRTDIGGTSVRRNYSICTPATEGERAELAIGVRHLDGGAFSTFAVKGLKAGDSVDVMTPTGSFGSTLDSAADDRAADRRYVAIAAGSGITPILSMLQTALAVEPTSIFTLIYGNRSAKTTMFADTLERLQSQYGERLEVFHVYSRDPGRPPAQSGHIDRYKLGRWLGSTLVPETIDDWFLCGPVELVTTARDTLVEHLVDPDRIHVELFHGSDRNEAQRVEYPRATVTVRISDCERTFDVAPGDSILEAALLAGVNPPYACMGGACGTCKAGLVAGSVEMDHDYALSSAELRSGYVLTCQSHPTSPSVTVDYDRHPKS